VRALTIAAWRVLGCSGYARVDFRLDEQNRPFILEVNPNPDLTPGDGFDAALQAAGIPFERFVWMMLQNALAVRTRQALSISPEPSR